MKPQKLTAIVLGRRNYREADKIVTVFTREKGKIDILARGVRRIYSRRGPHLEPFSLALLSVSDGAKLESLHEVSPIFHYPQRNNLKEIGLLFFVAEVLSGILPEGQKHEEVFDLLRDFLFETEKEEISEHKIKTLMLNIIWDLGYLPSGEYPKEGVSTVLENILEKKIKSKKFLEEI